MSDIPLLGKRWQYYSSSCKKEVGVLWKELRITRSRHILFVIGSGFDPRMCAGIKTILGAVDGQHECLLIKLESGTKPTAPELEERRAKNRDELNSTFAGRGNIREESMALRKDGRWIGDLSASRVFSNFSSVQGYTDVVVDTSALPRSIYFCLIAKLLSIVDSVQKDNGTATPNIHAVVAENSKLDSSIQEDGIDEKAEYLFGFSSDLESEAHAHLPKIWIPVLGERKLQQLERIHDLVEPDEVCPVLPSPSLAPRRSDTLVQEYREFLFDRLRIEPSNIVFASESNPFEAYRQISNAMTRYNQSLRVLGGSRIVVSALSSKLLSIGALLAAYEGKVTEQYMVGIAHVEPQSYQLRAGFEKDTDHELFSLFLAGEAYES